MKKEQSIGYWCKHVFSGYRQGLHEGAQHIGLTGSASLLIHLLSEFGPSSLVELSRLTEHTHPSVLRHLDELENDGFAERLPHPEDRRKKIIQLTAKGQAVAPKLKDILQEVNAKATANLEESEIEIILTGLRKMTANLGGCPTSFLTGKDHCCPCDCQDQIDRLKDK